MAKLGLMIYLAGVLVGITWALFTRERTRIVVAILWPLVLVGVVVICFSEFFRRVDERLRRL